MATTDRRLLMIAFHFPPFRGSSGIQRTLGFCRYLPEFGWHPVVLAPHPRAYPTAGSDLGAEVPRGVPVHRAFALDVARHLAIGGAYPAWMAVPDRYNTWVLGAIPTGLRMIRRYRPRVLWSTFPLATAHLIGYLLHRLSGVPWVADFRDPMVYEAWPVDPLARRVYSWLERLAVTHGRRAVCVTPGAVDLYRRRYAALPPERFALVANGYDEDSFTGLTRPDAPPDGRPLTLVHSGLLEVPDRDPTAFFGALGDLKRAGKVTAADVKVVLRASGFEARFDRQLEEYGIRDLVVLEPGVTYREALREMIDADGLLLFQGPECNRQIPAKAYEYLRAGTPVFGLVDPAGDTHRLLMDAGISTVVPLGARSEIAEGLMAFLAALRARRAPSARGDLVRRYTRRALTGALGRLLDECAGDPA